MKTICILILVTHTHHMTPTDINILLKYLKTDEGRNDLSPEFNYTAEEILMKAKKKYPTQYDIDNVKLVSLDDIVEGAGDMLGKRIDISDFFIKTKYEGRMASIVEGKIELVKWMEERIKNPGFIFKYDFLEKVKAVITELKTLPDDAWIRM